jgi:hypothetical protein
MLARVGESHIYGTRAVRSGMVVSTGDHRMVGYRVPTEWGTLTEEQRAIMSVAGFNWNSKSYFLVQYGSSCVGWQAAGCVGADCCAAIVLIIFVYCCCHDGSLLPRQEGC